MSDSDVADGTREIIARTAQKYDEVLYDSKPFPHSQPSRMAALAQYFGLATTPIDRARVLEIGGASGGNLIPHAVRYPNAQFVGLDIGRVQIEAGQARIARLGLSNIELRCESLTDVDASWGQFDYIICHGVHSWVPAPIQDAIFRVIRAQLSPVGIACVSYNVLPGWRMFQPFRDALLLNAPDQHDLTARLAQTRDLLGFMRISSDPGPYGDMLRLWGERLARAPDYYLAHEYLEEVNTPTTMRDFAAAAAGHGLGYLCDCDISTMTSDNYGPEAAQYVRAHAGNDVVETEQYLDILSGRTFRQSLLIAEERLAKVDRTMNPERILRRHLLTRDGVTVEPDGDQFLVRDVAGAWVRTPSAAAAEGIARLLECYPSTTTFEECAEAITSDRVAGRKMLLEAVHNMFTSYIVTLSSEPIIAATAGDRPKATTLARADAADGAQATTNLRHELVPLEPVMCILLPAMDGTLDRAGLIRLLEDEARAGRLNFLRDDQPVTDAEGIRQVAEEQLSAALASMARLSILEG